MSSEACQRPVCASTPAGLTSSPVTDCVGICVAYDEMTEYSLWRSRGFEETLYARRMRECQR